MVTDGGLEQLCDCLQDAKTCRVEHSTTFRLSVQTKPAEDTHKFGLIRTVYTGTRDAIWPSAFSLVTMMQAKVCWTKGKKTAFES